MAIGGRLGSEENATGVVGRQSRKANGEGEGELLPQSSNRRHSALGQKAETMRGRGKMEHAEKGRAREREDGVELSRAWLPEGAAVRDRRQEEGEHESADRTDGGRGVALNDAKDECGRALRLFHHPRERAT